MVSRKREQRPQEDLESRRSQVLRSLFQDFVSQHDLGVSGDREPVEVESFCSEAPDSVREELRRRCEEYLETLRHIAPSGSERSEIFPSRLGSLALGQELGKGGTGTVLAAVDQEQDREVAVKILHHHLASCTVARERLRREYVAVFPLDHPNIAKVFALGNEKGWHYIVMQRIHGRSLAEVLEGAVQEQEAGRGRYGPGARIGLGVRIVHDMAKALAYAHSQGLIHRDVKPQNVLLDQRGRAYLADFGLAQFKQLETLARSGQLMGTPLYMSPEQVLARRAGIDHRTDLYSLGIVFYEVLTLVSAVQGTTEQEVLFQISFGKVVPPRKINPQIPEALETICLKAIEKNPNDRYATARDLLLDLRRYQRNERILARRPSWIARAGRWLRGGWMAAALVIVLALLGTLVFSILNPFREKEPRALPAFRFEVGDSTAEVKVEIRPIDEVTEELSAAVVAAGALEKPHPLTPGWYRIRFEGEGESFSETTRRLTATPEPSEISVRFRSHDEVTREMIYVEPSRTEMVWRCRPEGSADAIVIRSKLNVAGFWIDRGTVTNADFRSFLDDNGGPVPLLWPEELSQDWIEEHPGWLELPVVGVSLARAQAFAQWAGKRLPTRAEWTLAARGREEARFPWGDDSERFYSRVNIRPPGATAGRSGSFEAYFEGVLPSRESNPEGDSWCGLQHPLGNVWEWTVSPAIDWRNDRLQADPKFVYILGYSWKSGFLEPDGAGFESDGLAAPERPDTAIGFRCVRSQRS